MRHLLVAAEGTARDGDGARVGGEGAEDDGLGGVDAVGGVGDVAAVGAGRRGLALG